MLLWLADSPVRAELRIETIGAEEIVFAHKRDACQPEDIPDEPARALRDAAGRVHLFATHYLNFGAVGSDLASVKRDCTIVFDSARNDDPARFDDREWLASFWTPDGITVAALAHNEFQGHLRPWLCPSRIYSECWYNAVVAAFSQDGGFHFSRAERALVAAPAYRYDPAVRHPVGQFNPSNIVERDGYYYVMTWAEATDGQRGGVCLLRTRDPTDPQSWRAWDGGDFSVRLGSPYLRPADQPPHTCTPIAPDRLRAHVWSLVRHQPTGRYLALTAAGLPQNAFYISDSEDLFNWSEPRKFMNIGPAVPGECGDRPRRGYPSLIDPVSSSRNFETVGDTAYLYYTKYNFEGCAIYLDRDLVRVPVGVKR